MKIHYLQHVPFENPGSILEWAMQKSHIVTATHVYRGDPLPDPDSFDMLIIMGGPMSVNDDAQYPWLAAESEFIASAIQRGKKVLGICLGAQMIASALGAAVYQNLHKEIGWFSVQKVESAVYSPFAAVLPDEAFVFHWHGETFDLPDGADWLMKSRVCRNQAFALGDRVLALQFHLETMRDNVELLIAHCGNELTDAPYIQTPDDMLADDAHFRHVNAIMCVIMDYFDGLK
ncbi:type 1 glutamine amidotransferase [candidate division KSB1 bacterium]|nr:type 1 glutamine amidotransferase [candidate division KSB1 bacterium]